jgi:hypothetical protein
MAAETRGTQARNIHPAVSTVQLSGTRPKFTQGMKLACSDSRGESWQESPLRISSPATRRFQTFHRRHFITTCRHCCSRVYGNLQPPHGAVQRRSTRCDGSRPPALLGSWLGGSGRSCGDICGPAALGNRARRFNLDKCERVFFSTLTLPAWSPANYHGQQLRFLTNGN